PSTFTIKRRFTRWPRPAPLGGGPTRYTKTQIWRESTFTGSALGEGAAALHHADRSVAAVVTGHSLYFRKEENFSRCSGLTAGTPSRLERRALLFGERVCPGVLPDAALLCSGRLVPYTLQSVISCISRDDDDEEEEEDDEIDVVSVDSQPKRGRLSSYRTPVTITVSADPFGPCPKRFHVSLHRQQHNYAAPSPDTDPEDDFEMDPISKRPRLESSSAPSSPVSSPATSDSEDSIEVRRNFLERKRRDDLRSRFQALRKEIPGLSSSSKTSKVAILTRATEYVLQLHSSQRRQAREKRKLKAKQQQLLHKISALKN
ncbi:hypothetical protein DNTS_032859, partial [Danionella cerebrum]